MCCSCDPLAMPGPSLFFKPTLFPGLPAFDKPNTFSLKSCVTALWVQFLLPSCLRSQPVFEPLICCKPHFLEKKKPIHCTCVASASHFWAFTLDFDLSQQEITVVTNNVSVFSLVRSHSQDKFS